MSLLSVQPSDHPYFPAGTIGASPDEVAAGRRHDGAMLIETPPTRLPFETLKVRDVMHEGVVSCPPDTALPDVAELMSTHGIHAVFVFDDNEHAGRGDFLGIVSDLDLVAAAWAGLETRTAGQSAVTPILTVTTEDALERAAELMVEHSVSHLSVVDRSTRQPVGVLSTIDIARVVATPG
jgi:CBS domain-containing protein